MLVGFGLIFFFYAQNLFIKKKKKKKLKRLEISPINSNIMQLKMCYYWTDATMQKPSTKVKHHCFSQTGQSATWWWKKAPMAKFQNERKAFQWWATARRFSHIISLSYFSFSNFLFSVVCEVLVLMLGCLTSLLDRHVIHIALS